MKTAKRIISFLLCAVMVFGMFSGADFGLDSSIFELEASAADITLGGITQTRVVSDYASKYAEYRSKYFTGSDTNWPTNFVIPGLSSSNDYTPQGMTYWKAKEWILISAYDASGNGKNSVIYAIDAVTTDFVALFNVYNSDGSVNTSHGGGIAASDYNFYYADKGSKISYVPLSEMDVPVGTVKSITLKGSIDCSGEMNTAYTSYCCYDEGVLWTGNFYLKNDNYDYNQPANASYNSMLLGYKLHGNSSEEEWYYLSQNYNVINVTTASGTNSSSESTMNWTATNHNGSNVEIRGNISYGGTYVGEFAPYFASFNLTEGVKYKIEYITNHLTNTDFYMFAPNGGGHMDIKLAKDLKVTDLGDGRAHCELVFTAGLKSEGTDSLWPATQSTDGTYTGTYTMRFDQDAISANRDFVITDLSISEYAETDGFEPDSAYEGIGCEGNPTYAIAIDNTYDKIQYAMVDKGKIYMSRSWSRNMTGSTHVRALAIADIDINAPGTVDLTVNGRTRKCHLVSSNTVTQFGVDKNTGYSNKDILAMGEALCVMNDYLYMFGESAAWNYNGKESDNKCGEPVDVIWKIDQHAILDEERPAEELPSVYYEKVTDFSQINGADSEYLVVYESKEKDPVTQKNIIYALDSFGGYNGAKLPKQNNYANTGDSIGIIGYPITSYSTGMVDGKDVIYLNETDDSQDSIRWNLTLSDNNSSIQLSNKDFYFGTNSNLNFNERNIIMSSSQNAKIGILPADANGNFYLFTVIDNDTAHPTYLWCNDGTIPDGIVSYTNYYLNHTITDYVPVYNGATEVKGTFHVDALKNFTDGGNVMATAIPDYSYGQFKIYKKYADPYAGTKDTDVFTDLNAELQPDGTYTVNLETYATAAVQYMDVEERPTDYIFVLDTAGAASGANGYHTASGWDPLLMKQACGDVAKSFFERGDNYNTAHSGNYYFKFPDGEFGQIHVAFNEKGSSSKYERDIWLWAEHPVTKRCYRLSKFGFMTHGNFAGGADWDEDISYRISDADFLSNQNNLGWANEAAVMADVSADRYRTDYHGTSYSSTEKRSNYQLMYYSYSDAGVTASYYTNASSTRLEAMQQFVEKMSFRIAADNSEHRVSLITFDNSTAATSYMNDGSTSNSNATTDWSKIYFTTSQFSLFRSKVKALTASGEVAQPSVGLTRAANTFNLCGVDYTPTGTRAACVILITSGQGVTDNVINNAITMAKDCKSYGAFVYSVKVGDVDENSNNVKTLFEYTSSNYINAESIDKSGDRNKHTDINYYSKMNDYSRDYDRAGELLSLTVENSKKAYLRVNEDTIIRENIGEFFDISDAQISYKAVQGKYDGLDRLYFDEKTETEVTGLTTKFLNNNYTLQVNGFDFSEEYVSTSHLGRKLVVSISGLTLDTSYDLKNVNVTDDETTGLYLDENYLGRNEARKRYPMNFINIPEYTYILDYGLEMLDTDVNGTLQAISNLPTKQNPDNYNRVLDADNVTMTMTDDSLDLLYGVNPSTTYDSSQNSGYCLIKRDNGTYDWFKINIVPASNVYFEETSIKLATGNNGYSAWEQHGTESDFWQSLTDTENDVYGYDKNYMEDNSDFSHGTVYKTSVDSTTMRSDTLSFNYTGDAIDLYASCGEDTGIYIITIKNGDKIEKAYITDTYTADETLLGGNSRINQVPVIHHENEYGYGEYTVEITSAFLGSMIGQRGNARTMALRDDVTFYTSDLADQAKEAVLAFAEMEYLLDENVEVTFCDENSVLNGGSGADVASDFGFFAVNEDSDREFSSLINYFDGFRVYNVANHAYDGVYPEAENGAVYYNVVDELASARDILNGEGDLSKIAYISAESTDGEITFADYKAIGPKNELYLVPGAKISFNLSADNTSAKAMISMRAVNGATKATVMTASDDDNQIFDITNSTEMYYRIDNIDFGGEGLVIIENSGDSILAIDTLKLCNGFGMMPMMMSATPRMRMMMAAPATETEPNAPIEEEVEITSLPEEVPDIAPLPDNAEEPSTESDENEPEEQKSAFEEFIDMLKSFIDKVIGFFKNLIELMGGK